MRCSYIEVRYVIQGISYKGMQLYDNPSKNLKISKVIMVQMEKTTVSSCCNQCLKSRF